LNAEVKPARLRGMLPRSPPPGSRALPTNATSGMGARGAHRVSYDETQLAVIHCHDKNVVAEAFAGAGKTTVAVGFTDERPDTKFLYVCLNKANATEAAQRFGSHVECRTSHSLAYQAVGSRFRDQLVKGSWRPRQFAEEARIPGHRSAAVVQSVLNNFFSSCDKQPGEVHVEAVKDHWDLDANEQDQALALSRMAWTKMQKPGSGVSIPHDCYLKIWALSNPKLGRYEHIILDEAQDTNPVTAEIIERQTHAGKLLIGDRHQSIYLFRGALNAMEAFSGGGATVLKMPKTWRFGPDIAAKASRLLAFFKGEETAIIGAGPKSAARGDGKRAVLARTNAGLYAEAAAVRGEGVYWIGGIENYRVDVLRESYLLKAGRRDEITDPSFRAYASWTQYVDEAASTRDAEARMLIKLNEEYGKDVPYLVQCFKRNAVPTETGARTVLGTAHKAKGLDFDHVTVGEDFECLESAQSELMNAPDMNLTPQTVQEINLLYVTLSRARHQLDLNTESRAFFSTYEQRLSALVEARSPALREAAVPTA